MHKKNQLSCAISIALATMVSSSIAHAEIEQIMITATKRTESIQDVPVSVQALGEESLDELIFQSLKTTLIFCPASLRVVADQVSQRCMYVV